MDPLEALSSCITLKLQQDYAKFSLVLFMLCLCDVIYNIGFRKTALAPAPAASDVDSTILTQLCHSYVSSILVR